MKLNTLNLIIPKKKKKRLGRGIGSSKGKKKSEKTTDVAQILIKKALEKKITNVYFDRGGYKFHGRIKSLAEAIRKGGLRF